MKLIDKIKKYVQDVVQLEKDKKGDEHDYSHGKFAVAAVIERMIEDHPKDQAPRLHPISELPQGNSIVFLAVLENDAGFSFLEVIEGNEYLYQGAGVDYAFTKKEDFQNEDYKMIGWLYELPNPNEIKL